MHLQAPRCYSKRPRAFPLGAIEKLTDPLSDYALGDGEGEAESDPAGDGEALELFLALDFFFVVVDVIFAPLLVEPAFMLVDLVVVLALVEVVVVAAGLLAQAAINPTAAMSAIVEAMDFFIGWWFGRVECPAARETASTK